MLPVNYRSGSVETGLPIHRKASTNAPTKITVRTPASVRKLFESQALKAVPAVNATKMGNVIGRWQGHAIRAKAAIP